MHMALGAFFFAAEAIPLTILTFEALAFVQLGGVFVLGLLDSKRDAKNTIWNPKKMLSSTFPKTA
jgi:hypothetical protein